MTHSDDNQSPHEEEDGLSAVNLSSQNWSSKNKRISPRYVRDDIVIALCETTSLNRGELFIDFVHLNDVTSRGLSFSSARRFSTNKKIILNLRFRTEVSFKISGTIIHRINSMPYQYGVKFDSTNHELSEYLLESQSILIFK